MAGELTGWISFAGSSSWRADGGHKATYTIRLTSRANRDRSDAQIANELAARLKNIYLPIFCA